MKSVHIFKNKMSWVTYCLLVFSCILEATLALDSTTTTYYVLPSNSSGNCPSAECHNLSYYIEHQSSYFKSHSAFVFMKGTHIASETLTQIENVKQLSLSSNSSKTEVQCGTNIGFHFINATELQIEGLTFINCGSVIPGENKTISALSFRSGTNLSMAYVSIVNSFEKALYIKDILGPLLIQSCTFQRSNNNIIHNSNYSQVQISYKHCKTEMSTLQLMDSNIVRSHHTGLHLQVNQKCSSVNVSFTNVVFHSNMGGHLAIDISRSVSTNVMIERCSFSRGCGNIGGAILLQILAESSTPTQQPCHQFSATGCGVNITVQDSNFTSNYASAVGGAIYLRQRALKSGAGNITISNCKFENNTIGRNGHGGLAFHSVNYQQPHYLKTTEPQYAIEISDCNFDRNSLINNGRNAAGSGVLVFQSEPYVGIKNTNITDNNCSGILAVNSNLIMQGNLTIKGNRGSSGGGLFLSQNTRIYLHPHTMVAISCNKAQHVGGGIFVDDNYQIRSPCFFQFYKDIDNNNSLLNTTQIHLEYNSARVAGDALYGGSVENCYLESNHYKHTGIIYNLVFNTMFKITPNKPSSISSNPQRVCFCNKKHKQDCSMDSTSIETFRGGPFKIFVSVVGQRNGTRPGDVSANITTKNTSLENLQAIQSIEKSSCGPLTYNVFTKRDRVAMQLRAKQPGDTSVIEYLKEYRPLNVTVKLKECPMGFNITMSSYGYSCDCVELLGKNNITCNITSQVIKSYPPHWIGYMEKTSSRFVVYYSHCPRDYCKTIQVHMKATNVSFRQDKQCAFNRTGILCGACSGNLSIMLGTSNCSECSKDSWLIIIAFAVAGIALVIFISVLNLTVTEGTLPAIIFYANIVQINAEHLFVNDQKHKFITFLKTFIAWINLDIGIEVCLYKGMNSLAKALLQFVFPVYIWLISGAIIWASRRSFTVSRILGNNAVKVLATLILLSYAKLLRAIINGLAFTALNVNNINVSLKDKLVWKLDGNVGYLHGTHIALFTVASAFGMLMLPFTITLLLIRPLQKISHFRILCYIQRLKPFIDAYTGAHRAKKRYWPGLLLLIRIILFLIFASNTLSKHMIATVLATFFLAWIFQSGVYQKTWKNILEATSIINLGVLCSAALYAHDPTIAASVSTTIAFVLFIGVVLYHGFIKFSVRERSLTLIRRLLLRFKRGQHSTEPSCNQDLPPYRHCDDEEHKPLLDITNREKAKQHV